MSKTTPITLTTKTLSKIADALLVVQRTHHTLNKSQILYVMAQIIAGKKHDWGYLTKMNNPFTALDTRVMDIKKTVYFYHLDEQDSWGRAPVGPFESEKDLYKAIENDTWWHHPNYDVLEVIETLKTSKTFIFNEDGDDSAYSLSILSYQV